jgi:multidrug efflux pump subunit AcrA (membrane-fusion protein)
VLDPQTWRVQQRQVMLGDVDAAGVVVTSGLQPGDQVVTTGVDRLRDGQVVELAGQGPR